VIYYKIPFYRSVPIFLLKNLAKNCQKKDKNNTQVVQNMLGEDYFSGGRQIFNIEQTIAEMIEIKRQA
jgi:hypothetical protein